MNVITTAKIARRYIITLDRTDIAPAINQFLKKEFGPNFEFDFEPSDSLRVSTCEVWLVEREADGPDLTLMPNTGVLPKILNERGF